jgi:ribonuclease BN (tRNA processing enzyme)
VVPFKIMMLGVGNGFSKDTYNNNALIEVAGSNYLIDCGITAWTSLDDLGIAFEDIEGIFITHLHFDHSGGLQEAALYGAYVANKKIKLYLPRPLKEMLWEEELKGALYNPSGGKGCMEDYFEIIPIEENEIFLLADQLPVYWIQTEHVRDKFSSSLVLDQRFFYSGDMVADEPLMSELYSNGVRVFYHDVHFNEVVVHASFEEVSNYPTVIKEHLYAMHYGVSVVDERYLNSGISFLQQHQWKSW